MSGIKERPILFSAPMVRAILEGTKTQTRIEVKNTPEEDRALRAITGPKGAVYSFWVRDVLAKTDTQPKHSVGGFIRITLETTGVRKERLQDISDADAMAEGVEKVTTSRGLTLRPEHQHWRVYGGEETVAALTAKASYRSLWESINGPGSWDANPWVWVVEFKRVDA